MNIRVDLNYPIKDGTEVVFRSPVDCSQVTGLKVYYPNGSQEFSFADAHGNNVGDIDHLFAENVVVKVILDVTTSMAFVQNADTNAYLEGRFDDIVDKLCPSFSESGSAVRCEPVEGYPLRVVTELPEVGGAITLTQCGKNLFDYTQYPFTDIYIKAASGEEVTSSGFSGIKKYAPVGFLKGQVITLNHPPAEATPATNAGLAFYDAKKTYISGDKGYTHIVPDNAEYMRFSIPREWADGTNGTAADIQIELGSVVTEFEPYRDPVQYAAEATDVVHEWIGVKAIPGVNTIWSSNGTTTVSGKADPVAIVEKLTNAILSLGGNI